MTTAEENKELRERLKEYEEMLKQILEEGEFHEGVIASNSSDGMYRIQTDGGFAFKYADPRLGKLKEGTRVMFTKDAIKRILPEELMLKPEPVDFKPVEWDEIGGLKSQVDKIRETIELPLKHTKLYKEYGLSPSKGVVLYGPPGCGKTMVAKAIASTLLYGFSLNEDSFIYLKGGEMLSPYVGVAENNIKSIFERARNNYKKTKTRSVIFIDEAEAILPARGSRRSSDVDSTIVPTFLSEIDGFEDNATFIILATNFANQLDPAVVRPGRIDLKIAINRPDEEDVKEILDIYLSKTKVEKNLDTASIAKKLYAAKKDTISGAMIKNVVEKATMSAIKRDINNKVNRFAKAFGFGASGIQNSDFDGLDI